MRFLQPVSLLAGVILLGLGIMAGPALLAADAPAAKEKAERGGFVSFQEGTLTLKANSGALLANKIPESAKTLVWNHDAGLFQPAATVETLNRAKPGTWLVVRVSQENVTLHIGARRAQTVGTFVSFKNGRLLILGKNLGESYVKKYGNNLHFNKFRDDVPAFESVDGGEYQPIGEANKVLANVKEGTIVTIHGEGDDNITLVQIGVPKGKAPEKAPAKAADKPADKATEKAPDKTPAKAADKTPDTAVRKETVRGWFASFEEGTLSLMYTGGLIQKIKIPEHAKTLLWNHDANRFDSVDTAQAMNRLKVFAARDANATDDDNTPETLVWRKAGTGMVVDFAAEDVTLRIGQRMTPYVGNFVSLKDDLLTFRLKNPSQTFQKAYGDTVRFKMREDIPVYESIDGGEYQRVGTPRAALGSVKEGTLVTVFHHYKTETDEFHLILIGVQKK